VVSVQAHTVISSVISSPSTLTLILLASVKEEASLPASVVGVNLNESRVIHSTLFDDLTINLARFKLVSVTRTEFLLVTGDSPTVTDHASTTLILAVTSDANPARVPFLSEPIKANSGVQT
jgi:hypothetical protein